MPLLYVTLGTLVLLLAITDVVWSTLSAAGGGPLSRRLGRLIWVATRRAAFAGPLVLVATAMLWVGLFWIGWTLVFLGGPAAAVSASTGAPADFWERVYFAGYTVITLGLGDFVPATPAWRLVSVVSAATGLVFITLAVTYYTAVLSAVVHKQQLAALVRALGPSPGAIVAGAWEAGGFPGLGTILTTLADHLTRHARQHYAYPVLHYFRPRDAESALPVQAARLDDALLLLDRTVHPDHRPPPGPLRLARRSLGAFLQTLEDNFVARAERPPPPPDLGPLRAAALPLADDADGAFDAEDVQAERRLLLGFVRDARFAWSDVARPAR